MVGPRLIVDPPVFTPQPFGLMSVVQTPTASDSAHWQNGITYQARCLSPMGAATYDDCIAVTGIGGGPPKANPTANVLNYLNRGATPFTPYARFDCAPVGNPEALKVATTALAQSEAYQVERAFWTGVVDGQMVAFPHLAANAAMSDAQGYLLQTAATTIVTGAAVDIATGLGLLEQQLANCYNGVGVIHVPMKALPTLDAWGLVKAVNGQLRTLNGNLVAAGAGYTGSSPAGVAPIPGESWFYATGAVFMYRGDVKTFPLEASINRNNNTLQMMAERTYVLGWDCCHAGILIDIGVPII